jgi:hypothetical protein
VTDNSIVIIYSSQKVPFVVVLEDMWRDPGDRTLTVDGPVGQGGSSLDPTQGGFGAMALFSLGL